MPRSSRSKSHKQSKHSSRGAAAGTVREYADFEEDVKMKERSNNDGNEDGFSVRVSKDSSVSGEKRKLGKDLSGSHANGNLSEEYTTPTKRRKEKIHDGSDRWNGDGGEEKGEVVNIDDEKLLKSKDLLKVVGESKNKTSRRHDVDSASVVAAEKDESKSASSNRGEKRSEKESGRKENRQFKEYKESKDKDRGSERERKIHDGKREAEVLLKQVENQPSKRGRESNECPIEEGLRNIELEKELEKRMRRRGEGSRDKDRYEDDVKEGDERMLSTKSARAKDVKHKDEAYGDKYRKGSDRETRHREDKYREDGERVNKSRDVKRRREIEKDNKHRDDKYHEDGERDRQHEDKYLESGNRVNRQKDDKYHNDGDRDGRHRDEKHRESGDRGERNTDDKHRQDDDRDCRHKEERNREDVDRDHRHRNGRFRDDTDREKRLKDSKRRDVHTSRDHPGELETKNLKDDSNAADLGHRKTNSRGGSPICDDRVARHKDDKGRRRNNDKDESISIKDQHSESDKRSMSNAKVEPISERGRPSSRSDMEITANHSCHRSSPSGKFYPSRDHYRVSKQEETKYRDHVHEERAHHNVRANRDFTSAPGQSDKISSQSLEKITQKDDNYIDDLSVERHLRSDTRSSPLVDKSSSPTSNEHRHLNRPDGRRKIDVEELGQRSGGSKHAKEYLDKDGKGSRKLAMEGHPDNDLSQLDGDDMSVSSPYTRSGHFPGNYKSLLPPQPPFRTGSDGPLSFGASEDNRGKSNNRHRRLGDPNMGRAHNNWKNVPHWASPLPNGGYIPFQHVPPPMFHPALQQFAPPIFGRPPVEVNHTGMPYQVPDGDRFSGHGHPLAWRNQVEESIPPPLQGWEANNAIFGDEPHGYGRVEWDHGRSQLNNQMWESSADLWKGQDAGVGVDMQSAPQLNDPSAHRPTGEIWSGQMSQHTENEQSRPDVQAETTNNTPETIKVTESPHISEVAKEDDSLISQVYLSKIDISEDLTQPELYDQCTLVLDLDQATISDEFDCKILFLEEGMEADINNGSSLFDAVDDSVFKKAMSLYTKQKVEVGVTNRERVSDDTELVLASDQEKGGLDDDGQVEGAIESPVLEVSKEKDESPIQKLDMDPLSEDIVSNKPEISEEQISASDKVDGEVDHPVVKQEEESSSPSLGRCEIEVKDSGNNSDDKELLDKTTGGGSLLLFTDVSTTTEVVMPELIEFGSVNLSRIHHHSPESTH